MDDDFLRQYRKQPHPALIEAVYQKINTNESMSFDLKKVSLAFAAFFVLLVFTLSISPRARGAALELVREIGGLRFHETSDYPGAGEPVEIVESKYVSLEEARRVFPGTISLPGVLPDGYSPDPEVELIDFNNGSLPVAILKWQKKTPEGGWNILELRITYMTEKGKEFSEVVGNGAIEEITINGKPAALVSGGWNYDTQSYDLGIPAQGIRWKYDEHTTYALESGIQAISKEALIEIAESIP